MRVCSFGIAHEALYFVAKTWAKTHVIIVSRNGIFETLLSFVYAILYIINYILKQYPTSSPRSPE